MQAKEFSSLGLEGNLKLHLKFGLEMILNLFGQTEVNEIINKESQIQRRFIGKE